MIKIIPFWFLSFFATKENPFSFVGKSKTDIDVIIGKPIVCDSKDGDKTVYAYPFSKYGDYHILYVSDTVRAFTYKPTKSVNMTMRDVPNAQTLKPADKQPEDRTVWVSEKIRVESKGDRVLKVVMLR